jgi:hypothetical protein
MPMRDAPATTRLERLRDHDRSVRSLLDIVRLDRMAPPRRLDDFRLALRSASGSPDMAPQLQRI